MSCRKCSYLHTEYLPKQSVTGLLESHGESMAVRSHGESACRYIGLPGGQLAASRFGGLSVGCSFSLGTSDQTCNKRGSSGAGGCYSMNAGTALKECG